MIPQRTLRNDLAGTELRERVTECRKRLRHNRFIQRAGGSDATAPNEPPNATFLDAEPAMRESLLSSQLSSAASAVSGDRLVLNSETAGVGIT